MNRKEFQMKVHFNRLLNSVTTQNRLDPDKIKMLPDTDKVKMITYLLLTERPIIKALVDDNEKQFERIKKHGYFHTKTIGSNEFWATIKHIEQSNFS